LRCSVNGADYLEFSIVSDGIRETDDVLVTVNDSEDRTIHTFVPDIAKGAHLIHSDNLNFSDARRHGNLISSD
jgi:hypothetical protein